MRILIIDDWTDTVWTLNCFGKLSGHDVRGWTNVASDADVLARRLNDVQALVLIRKRTAITADLSAALPSLRVISLRGPLSHADVEACARGHHHRVEQPAANLRSCREAHTMKPYLLSLAGGLLVGVIYSLMGVRSSARPSIALVGLLRILLGKQILPISRCLIEGKAVLQLVRTRCADHVLGRLPAGDAADEPHR